MASCMKQRCMKQRDRSLVPIFFNTEPVPLLQNLNVHDGGADDGVLHLFDKGLNHDNHGLHFPFES